MKHARDDYNRIQDPAGKIPADEPVFLLRARDKYAARAVLYYAELIMADVIAPSSSLELAKVARDHAYDMRDWADEHGGAKHPDLAYNDK